jgi:hypothetical protein
LVLLSACAPTSGSTDLGSGGTLQVMSSGGAPSSGGTVSAGGTFASGGLGSSLGGSSPIGGAQVASGGLSSGGSTSGGASAVGGEDNSGNTGGASVGGTSATDEAESATEALVGLRVDDACAGNPSISVGATCDHAARTGAGFHGTKEAKVEGTPGHVYEVTLRVRGVVEPTNVVGGMRSEGGTFSYMGQDWREVPVTLGGSVPTDDADYSKWSIVVSEPSAEYFLNDFQRVGHYIFSLDYEVTVPVASGSTVVLDGFDDNERLIMNYESYAPEGVPGSVNHGQFVELDVVSATVR